MQNGIIILYMYIYTFVEIRFNKWNYLLLPVVSKTFLISKGHDSTRPLLISGILHVYTYVLLTLFLPVEDDDSICPNSGDTFVSYNQR